MCGICGMCTEASQQDLGALVAKLNNALIHRGPDDGGQLCDAPFAIAMRRLSIIDLSGGHQPIENEDGRYAIVFNGEIYNFPELREMLVQRGHRFATNSDTEVILHLFEDEGEETPGLLKGMFAFCIYDRHQKTFFLARDRFGEKPLYYFHDSDRNFVFSSEIKSLLEHPDVPRQLDYEALGYYMRVGIVPAPLTMFRDIRILPAGHWLRWNAGDISIRPYYWIDYCPDPGLSNASDAEDAVRVGLQQAVRRQKISDVDVGALLSGGIDSSAVASTLQSVCSEPIKTFTVSFDEAEYNEAGVARQVATHLGAEHHEIRVANSTFDEDDLWRIIDHVGLPFFDSSAIPTYVLSKHVRQEVKVVLSGDGGDELFAGYDLFQWGQKIRRVQKLPSKLIQAGALTTNWLGRQPFAARFAALRRVRRGLAGAVQPRHMLPISLHSLFEPAELHALMASEMPLSVATGDLPLLTDLPERAGEWSDLRQLMYFRLKHVLHDRMLTKTDRMSMAASLEIRTPMLDVDLAELSMRLPDQHLIVNGTGKSVLRNAIRGLVPEVVFTQPKTGFDIPLHRFQNDQYKSMARDLLIDSDVSQLFHRDTIQEVVRTGLSQTSNKADRSVFRSSHQLWALMQLSGWQRRFGVTIG